MLDLQSAASISDLGKAGPCNRRGEGLGWEFQKKWGQGVLTCTRGSPKVLHCTGIKERGIDGGRGGGGGWFLSLRSGPAEGTRWQVEAARRAARGKVRGFMVTGWAWAAAALQSYVCF